MGRNRRHFGWQGRVIPVAVALLLGAMGNASALTITNCSGAVINAQVSPSTGGTATAVIGPGSAGNLAAVGSLVSVKVFETGLVKTLRIAAPSIPSSGQYSVVRLANGQWQLVTGRTC